jgi:hypothetical protein
MTQFQKFISAQIKKIDIEKWLEGCNSGYDPGQEYVLLWIKENSVDFRISWESSNCKKCRNGCRHLTKQICQEFVEDLV